MLDFIFKIQEIKDVKRYGPWHEIFKESVADHSYMVCFMAIQLNNEHKLNLNMEKITNLALIHDLCEIGLEKDFDAVFASKNSKIKEDKQKYEEETITNLSEKYNRPTLQALFNEYEKQETEESKYIKAIDKLETNIFQIKKGTKYFANPEFIATYCDKAVENFPKLKPVLKELKCIMKEEYIKAGFEWKEEYDRV